MNFSSNEIILEIQRGRQWNPLITQQLRLRHINQLWCFNLNGDGLRTGSLYFTLHLTTMSAPFYTSENKHGLHPKWQDLTLNKCPSASAIVLRIWYHPKDSNGDTVLFTGGFHFSGLVYIGNKVTDVQPAFFNSNTVIFYMFGGFFTTNNSFRDNVQRFPSSFMEHTNMIDFPKNKTIFKRVAMPFHRGQVKKSYNVEKLRKLHYLEVMIKNKTLDVDVIQNKIAELDVLLQKPERNDSVLSPTKNTPQLLTMNCLNRMLQEKPTRIQKQEMFQMNKKIEIGKFRSKLLSHEHEKKLVILKQLRKKHAFLMENCSERESALMEDYHNLSRERDKLKEYHKTVLQHRELLVHTNSQLQQRKRQLLQQLLWIYPITQVSDNKYSINCMHLPNADVLSDTTDDGVSVALGYVSHILTMCSTFLQVPLRYPVTHYGSRSTITDQISANLPEREFPLFAKNKDRMQFTYGVYLLNKNIAQLRWLHFMHTPDLKLTLPNLLNFLQGYKELKQDRFVLLRTSSSQYAVPHDAPSSDGSNRPSSGSGRTHKLPPLGCYEVCGHCSDPILDSLRYEKKVDRSQSPCSAASTTKNKVGKEKVGINNGGGHSCPGLSEILAIPEAYLNRQMSSDSFQNYLSFTSSKAGRSRCTSKNDSTVVQKQNTQTTTTQPKNTPSSCDINLSSNPKLDKTNCTLTQCESVEEGTDLLNPKANLSDLLVETVQPQITKNKLCEIRVQAVIENSYKETEGSVTTETKTTSVVVNNDQKADQVGEATAKSLISKEQQEFMQNWLRTGPALVCSDKSLYPEEFLGTTASVQNVDSPLTARTDALVTTKSFNLVRPKH